MFKFHNFTSSNDKFSSDFEKLPKISFVPLEISSLNGENDDENLLNARLDLKKVSWNLSQL